MRIENQIIQNMTIDRELVEFLLKIDRRFYLSELTIDELPLNPEYRESAKNLAKYLILRSYDLRTTQNQLHHLGLSSLAASESHIHYQIQKVLNWLHHGSTSDNNPLSDEIGRSLTARRAQKIFGIKKTNENIPFLMVTIDERKCSDIRYFEKLLLNGMDIARINFAHSDVATTEKIVESLQTVCGYTGLSCKIYMDLAGPKLRTIIANKKKKLSLQTGEVLHLHAASKEVNPTKNSILIHEYSVFENLKPGHRIYFDDGKFYGIVEEVSGYSAVVRMIRVPLDHSDLKQDKGINLPDTYLNVSSLTEEDIQNLQLVRAYADIVGYSFVRKVEDIQLLRTYLNEYRISKPVIYKIETAEAVTNFAELLFEAMKDPLFGIMIARGDLAIEIGFERLAEIQEELLWLSEAAHTPVIWATQVLESLNKTGLVTRSEISDAVMASMSECVMLNKGKNILETLQTLKDILLRESSHRAKKRFTMRPLGIVQKFVQKHFSDI